MAADTSSSAAAITAVVEGAAAAVAALRDEPIPVTFAAATDTKSVDVMTYDITAPHPVARTQEIFEAVSMTNCQQNVLGCAQGDPSR